MAIDEPGRAADLKQTYADMLVKHAEENAPVVLESEDATAEVPKRRGRTPKVSTSNPV